MTRETLGILLVLVVVFAGGCSFGRVRERARWTRSRW